MEDEMKLSGPLQCEKNTSLNLFSADVHSTDDGRHTNTQHLYAYHLQVQDEANKQVVYLLLFLITHKESRHSLTQ